MSQAGRFASDALKDVVDERVHDAHGFAGDTSVWVNLLQHFVDVDSIAFLSLSSLLLLSIADGLGLSGFLLTFLSCYFGSHFRISNFGLNRMTSNSERSAIYNKTNKRSINRRIEIVDSSLADNLRLVKGHISHCGLQTKTLRVFKGDWRISILRKLNAADKFRCFNTQASYHNFELKPETCQVVAKEKLRELNPRVAHPELAFNFPWVVSIVSFAKATMQSVLEQALPST